MNPLETVVLWRMTLPAITADRIHRKKERSPHDFPPFAAVGAFRLCCIFVCSTLLEDLSKLLPPQQPTAFDFPPLTSPSAQLSTSLSTIIITASTSYHQAQKHHNKHSTISIYYPRISSRCSLMDLQVHPTTWRTIHLPSSTFTMSCT